MDCGRGSQVTDIGTFGKPPQHSPKQFLPVNFSLVRASSLGLKKGLYGASYRVECPGLR